MGYIAHDAVIVTVSGYVKDRTVDPVMPDIEGFRESMPAAFRHLLVGPIPTVTNGDFSYVLLPDGSKEGWRDSDTGDEWRLRFIALFSWSYEDGSTPFDTVAVRFGGDFGSEVGARVTYANGRTTALS